MMPPKQDVNLPNNFTPGISIKNIWIGFGASLFGRVSIQIDESSRKLAL
jgi:hypothetical protein